MTDLKFGWRNLNKKFYFIQDSRDGIVKDYNWNSYTEQDFSRGTDAINVYGNDTPPSVFSYAPENTFQYVSGTSNVNESTFISISGVFTPAKIVTSKNDSPTGESDFTIENNTSGPGTTFYVVHTADGTANYFIDGAIAENMPNFVQTILQVCLHSPVIMCWQTIPTPMAYVIFMYRSTVT